MHNKKQDIIRVTRKLISYFREQKKVGSEQEKDYLWARIENKVKSDRQSRKLKYIIAVAASAAVLLGAFWIMSDRLHSFENDPIKNFAATHIPESEDILLVISDTKQINIKSDSIITYSPKGEISLQSETLSQKDEEKKEEIAEVEYNHIIVPKGKRIQLVLSDASKLWVNSGTKVTYPRSFTGKNREIFVDGEVFLDVTHNDEIPFIVKTNDFNVRVLGTSFNICTYPELESDVVLVDGLVNIEDRNGKKLDLEPNQRIVIDENGLGEKQDIDIDEYIAWTKNLLILKSQPLANVFKKLHIYYGVEFEVDETARYFPLSGKLDLKDSIEKVVQNISKTAPISYQKNDDDTFIIKKK